MQEERKAIVEARLVQTLAQQLKAALAELDIWIPRMHRVWM